MSFKKSLIIFTIFLSACSGSVEPLVQKEKVYRYLEKELSADSVFTLSEDSTDVEFTKQASSGSALSTTISPQISGQITSLNIEIGDFVDTNTIIASLGNSYSTDANRIQAATAIQSLALSNQGLGLTNDSIQQSIYAATISADLSYQAFLNAKQAKSNSENLYYEQLDAAEINLETLEDAYDSSKDALEDARDALDLAELSNDPSQIAQAEAAVEGAKRAKEGAKTAIELAENGINQLNDGYKSQRDQLQFAINSSQSQFDLAKSQLNATSTGTEQQILASESQILQAKSAAELAALTKKYSQISSPISGIVTEIYVDEAALIGPGQPIAKIEKTDNIVLKTSLNEDEIKLISLNAEVEIIGDSRTLTGIISTISPTFNPATKKIDIEITAPIDSGIPAGTFMKIKFKNSNPNKVFIPLNAVFINDQNESVKIINSKKFIEYTNIETGTIIGDYIEVLAGLDGSETIVLATTTFLAEGDKVAFNK